MNHIRDHQYTGLKNVIRIYNMYSIEAIDGILAKCLVFVQHTRKMKLSQA